MHLVGMLCLPCGLYAVNKSLAVLAPCRTAGKTHRELLELEGGIQAQLDSGTAADPEYWQAVLKRLALHKAKARLREIHAGGWATAGRRMVVAWDGAG